jgi:hypothetical protein
MQVARDMEGEVVFTIKIQIGQIEGLYSNA